MRRNRLRWPLVALAALGLFALAPRACGDRGPRLAKATASGDEVVLLGDFNATGLADRTAIAALAAATQMRWDSADLGCTSYWRLPDECRGTALDQVLASTPVEVAAGGPCGRSCD